MKFISAFKGLKLLKKNRERAFKQFKLPRPQCVNLCVGYPGHFPLAGSSPYCLSENLKVICSGYKFRIIQLLQAVQC